MKHLVKLFLLFFLAGFATPAPASETGYRQLMDYLEKVFPDRQQLVAEISAFNGGRIAFPATGVSLEKGRELVILDRQADTPFYLLPPIGVLQIDGRVDDTYTARRTAAWNEKEPEAGDPVVTPSSPAIYLYSNIRDRDGFAPYRMLLQELIENDYEIVELDGPEFKPLPHEYGVILRFEGVDHHLALKLQSLYSGATLFSAVRPCEPDFQVVAAAGQPVVPLGSAGTEFPAKTGAEIQPPGQPSGENDFRKAEAEPESRILRLPENFQRLVICQLDDTEEMEFALLNDDRIRVFHRRPEGLEPVYAYNFKTDRLIGLHLHAMDLTGDGRDELAVTLGQTVNPTDGPTTRLNSMILSFRQNRLEPVAENIPFYLRVIADRSGKPVLLGQKKGEYTPFAGEIFEMQVNGDATVSETGYAPASGIHSVYQFNFLPGFDNKVMIIEPSGYISVYDTRTENMEAITDTNYGSFTVVPYPIRLEKPEFRGGFDKITAADVYAPRRFVLKPAYDAQLFTIDKQRKTGWDITKLKRILSDEKARDRLVAVKWTGQSIRQTWESEKLSRDVLDFAFTDSDGKDGLFLLIKDNQGFGLQAVE